MKLYQKALSYAIIGAVSVGVGLGILGCTTKTKTENNLEQKTEQIESEKEDFVYVSGIIEQEKLQEGNKVFATESAKSNWIKGWQYSFTIKTKNGESKKYNYFSESIKTPQHLDDKFDVGDEVKVKIPLAYEQNDWSGIFTLSAFEGVEINGEKLPRYSGFDGAAGLEKE